MIIKRVVILPTHKSKAFDRMAMPDGSQALVINRSVHEKALKSADKQLGKIVKSIKQGASRGRTGKAA